MSPRKKEETKSNPHIRAVKEKKKTKLILIGFIITAVLIVSMVGYAVLRTTVLKNFIPVAKIDGHKVDNEYFEARVRLERNSYIQQFQMFYAQYQLLSDDPTSADYFEPQLQQIMAILDDVELFGEMVLNNIIDDEIISMQGVDMGIDVSESEIDELMQQLFNYFPDGTPTPEIQPSVYTTPTISKTQEAIIGSTATPGVDEPDLEIVENGEDESNIVEETIVEPTTEPTIEPSPTITALTQTPAPTATPYTEEMYQAELDRYLGELEAIEVSENNLRKYIYHFLMKQKVRDAVAADVPLEQEQIWARHILVSTIDEAITVLSRLEEEEWIAVAAEVSLDTSNKDSGGDLRWFTRGQMVTEFEEAAFDLEIGEISDPVETQFGWHIIQLIDRGIRPLSQAEYENNKNIYFEEWFAGIKESIDISINDVWKDIVPDKPALLEETQTN